MFTTPRHPEMIFFYHPETPIFTSAVGSFDEFDEALEDESDLFFEHGHVMFKASDDLYYCPCCDMDGVEFETYSRHRK